MNVAVAQSGGPTCAINATLLGVFRHASKYDEIDKIYGAVNGIEGLINGNIVNLKDIITEDDDIELIRQTPSTVLGSCRYKLSSPEEGGEEYRKITENIKKYDIGAFFYIGGNDSMDTVVKLNKFFTENGIDVRVIGIPKTIDNDLPCTDHTPGFGSAAKYVAATIQEIFRDSSVYSIKSVTVVEIMGRDTGWLTASSSILRANGIPAPHLIYLPEKPFSVRRFLADIEQALKDNYAVIAAVSEGISINPDEYPADTKNIECDAFGHSRLAGVGQRLADIAEKQFRIKVRTIELSVMQRCSSYLSSKRDITEAERIGGAAVKEMLSGASGRMMCFNRVSNHPYNVRIESVDAALAANKVKYFPTEWIDENGRDVTHEAVEYFLPLIQGEQNIRIKNGIPQHYVLKKPLPGKQ